MLSRLIRAEQAVKIELANFGEDPQTSGSAGSAAPHVRDPGDPARRADDEDDFDLRPGRYRVWCSVADHHELGMRPRAALPG